MKKLHVFLATLLIVALAAPSAFSKKRRKTSKRKAKVSAVQSASLRLELIDRSLLGVPFGESVDGVMLWIEKRVARSYEPKFASALDARERDTLRHRMRQDIEALRQRIVSFEGQVTGFEASVVQGEFAVNAEEKLLLFRDATIDHYLFFTKDRLWKYARPLSTGAPFADRVTSWIRDQGEPSERRGEDVVVWQGADYLLRLENRRLVSASDLLVLELASAVEGVKALRKAAADAASKTQESSELDSYFE